MSRAQAYVTQACTIISPLHRPWLLQVSALSTQLYELRVVSEKRLAAAAAEGQAALRAEHLELQGEITSLAAKLAAETRKRQEFETEVGMECVQSLPVCPCKLLV